MSIPNAAFEAAQRYQVELRYGLDGKKGRARWEPFVGVESGEGASRALRLGVKLTSGRHLDAGLELGQRQGRPGADPERPYSFAARFAGERQANADVDTVVNRITFDGNRIAPVSRAPGGFPPNAAAAWLGALA